MIMTNGILLTARLILAATFLPSAVAHLSNISGLAAKISAMGFLYGEVIAAAVTLTEAVAPLAVVIGLVPRLSACTLLIASLVTTGILHRFWELEGAARQIEQTQFIAQLGIIAALLFYLLTGPGAWSWHGWWSGNRSMGKPVTKKKPPRSRMARSRPTTSRSAPVDQDLADAA